MSNRINNEQQALLNISDQCVMCGMCSPHCPTYIKTRNEAESPRGRISLIQALLRGKLELDEPIQQHLDSCLSCRACEAMCPSAVEYGKLIDGIRAFQREQRTDSNWAKERLLDVTASSKKLRNSGKLLRLAQLSGTYKLLQKGIEQLIVDQPHINQLLPEKIPARKKWQQSYPAQIKQRGHVALFTGCIADIVDQQTLRDAISLLTHSGFQVSIPSQQECCGALHHHSGDLAHSHQLINQNIEAFADNDFEHIIHCATGCGAHLANYKEIKQNSSTEEFSLKVDEISHFLLNNHLNKLKFKPLDCKVSVHLPCTQRNVLKQPNSSFELLKLIPQLQVEPLSGNNICCGAAGSYMLEQPEISQQLRQDKLDSLSESQAHILVSSNVGCAMHLAAGLREQVQEIEVIHPISLLARQLIT